MSTNEPLAAGSTPSAQARGDTPLPLVSHGAGDPSSRWYADREAGPIRAGADLKRVEVRERLRQLIDASQPGELLPSERTLSEQLGVSRPTLRAAIEDLARDGLLERSQGRGTFTSRPKISQELTPRTADDFGVPSP